MTYNSESTLYIGHISEHSTIYGPGIRFVIWTQGCTLACEGCWNKQYWAKNKGIEIQVEHLFERISNTKGIEGITLLGGEPLQQSFAVLNLIKRVKKLGLSVFLYTGYNIEEFNKIQLECYNLSDIVVSGRYIHSERDTNLRWRGSKNQQITFPTKKYVDYEIKDMNELELIIDKDGKISIFGYPDEEIKNWAIEI